MITHILLGMIGLSSGIVVAGGVISLIIELGIITRYAGITHTGKHIWLYEDAVLLGSLAGNIMTVYQIQVPLGRMGLAAMGLFFGMFVGGWILALAEIVNIIPVFFRRAGIIKGVSIVIVAMALGKTAGSMLHFYMRW